jgi:hypothetical protein
MSLGNIGTTGSVNYIDMPKNPLIKTNPYLKNPAERNAALTASVATSSAIEGVKMAKTQSKKPSIKNKKG